MQKHKTKKRNDALPDQCVQDALSFVRNLQSKQDLLPVKKKIPNLGLVYKPHNRRRPTLYRSCIDSWIHLMEERTAVAAAAAIVAPALQQQHSNHDNVTDCEWFRYIPGGKYNPMVKLTSLLGGSSSGENLEFYLVSEDSARSHDSIYYEHDPQREEEYCNVFQRLSHSEPLWIGNYWNVSHSIRINISSSSISNSKKHVTIQQQQRQPILFNLSAPSPEFRRSIQNITDCRLLMPPPASQLSKRDTFTMQDSMGLGYQLTEFVQDSSPWISLTLSKTTV